MKKLNQNTFTFRLPNGLRNKLETIADDNEVSLSELVRYSLNEITTSYNERVSADNGTVEAIDCVNNQTSIFN